MCVAHGVHCGLSPLQSPSFLLQHLQTTDNSMIVAALHLTTALVVVVSFVGVDARPAGPVLSLVGLLKDSVAGTPQFYKQQKWNFDPDVASRRQIEFQKVHGYRSLKLIEELGLGEDGRKLERLQQQRLRDQYVPVSGPIYEHKK